MDTMSDILQIKPFMSITIGIIVLFVGKRLNDVIPVLRNFSIPEPVTGGLLFSILLGILYAVSGVAIEFELTARDFCWFTFLRLLVSMPALRISFQVVNPW